MDAICYSSYSFCPILTKVSNTKKTVEQIFEILLEKFLANF